MTALRQSAGETNTGRKRRRNEDAYVCEPPLFAVADGMGGAQAGELASGLAAAALRENDGTEPTATGEQRVAGLIQEANRRVYQRSSEDAAVSGMGTTITVALVDDGTVSFGHVGDSRAYLIRDGRLEQLTEDHSLVAELVRSGKLSPEEAEVHPQRSVITRALGTDPDVDVDTFSVPTQAGDLFLICSDGLTSMVDDDVILAEAEQNKGDVRAAARALISAANRGGGEDNITVVFFEIGDDGEANGAPLEETAQMPALDETSELPSSDDEETLDELDRVPAIDTMVVAPGEGASDRIQAAIERGRSPEPAPEPAADRRARSARARQRFVATLVALLLVAVIVALVIWSLRS